MANNDLDEGEKINIITLGNSSVGKTSYILKYTDNCFQQVYLATVGIDFKTKEITLNNKKYKLYFYDTTGQERFKSISVNIVKNADGILLLYDITNKESFKAISEWMKSIREIKSGDFPIMLIGNKIDLEDERKITKLEVEELAKQFNIDFYEISNKEGINIEESCLKLINKIIEYKSRISKINEGVKLRKSTTKKKKSSDCKC